MSKVAYLFSQKIELRVATKSGGITHRIQLGLRLQRQSLSTYSFKISIFLNQFANMPQVSGNIVVLKKLKYVVAAQKLQMIAYS